MTDEDVKQAARAALIYADDKVGVGNLFRGFDARNLSRIAQQVCVLAGETGQTRAAWMVLCVIWNLVDMRRAA